MINFREVIAVVSVLIILVGFMMWTALPISWFFESGDGMAMGLSGLICVITGGILYLFREKKQKNIHKREGYLIVALGWASVVLFSTLPYLLSGVLPNFSNALFEAVSGLSTTGATVIEDIEIQPKGILYWRSLTQWLGGMGIVVLTVAIFPLLGIGGIELFAAEAPGPTSDKLHPRISETAKRLWGIYVGLTFILGIIYYLEGMSWYDAINHTFTTVATGGFSTYNASMAVFSPLIQYTAIPFMLMAGTNFTVLYLVYKRRFAEVKKNDEFKTYLFGLLTVSLLLGIAMHAASNSSWEEAMRNSLFSVVSLVTTTGYVTDDYTAYTPSVTFIFFMLLFTGACAGSTSGGIKVIRHLVFFRNSRLEFKRLLHPQAIVPLRLNGQIVKGRIITHVYTFLLLYLAIYVTGTVILSIMGLDFTTALGAMATSLGNVGPAIGQVGPMDNFAWLSAPVKIFLSFVMLLGRLELFTILILFSPYFWRLN